MVSEVADRSFARPWLALTGALAVHVTDEALTGFLELWNPMVLRLRESIPWSPFPTFSFSIWLGGLTVLVLALFLLLPFAAAGAAWLRPSAYLYGAIMLLNGFGHLAASVVLGRRAPGVSSAPLLIAASVWLLRRLMRSRAAGLGSPTVRERPEAL